MPDFLTLQLIRPPRKVTQRLVLGGIPFPGRTDTTTLILRNCPYPLNKKVPEIHIDGYNLYGVIPRRHLSIKDTICILDWFTTDKSVEPERTVTMPTIELEGGKYRVEVLDSGVMRFFRHNQPWEAANRDLEHSNLVRAMLFEIEELREKMANATPGIEKAARRIEELEGQLRAMNELQAEVGRLQARVIALELVESASKDAFNLMVGKFDEVEPPAPPPPERHYAQGGLGEGPFYFVWVKGMRAPVPQIWHTKLANSHGEDKNPFLFKVEITSDEAKQGPDNLAAKYPLHGITVQP